jgi:uncharacterized protein YndB with AHSA1/START domain
MPEASNEITIAQPPEVVFAYLADAENDREWRPGVVEIARQHGEGVGTRYRQVMSSGRRRIDADIEITEYEPDRRLAFRTLVGPVRPTGTYELTPADGGTALRFSLHADLTGPKRLLAPVVRKTMVSEVANLENLKRRLEAR